MTTWNPIKLTAMHHAHVARGATMTESDGWQRPLRYGSSVEEMETIQRSLGICDVSPVGKYLIQGYDIDTVLQKIAPQIRSLKANNVVVSDLVGQQKGSRIDSVMLSRLCEDELFMVTPSDASGQLNEILDEHLVGCSHLANITSNFAAINVSGVSSNLMLSKLTDLNLSPKMFPDLHCAQGMMAEVYVILVRCDKRGLPSYEVHVSREYGQYMWDAMLEAGNEYGVTAFGIETLKQLLQGG